MIFDLSTWERRNYSQNGEDGIIAGICQAILPVRYYVEFGVGRGLECNTRLLREAGWDGLLMDCSYEDTAIWLWREFITKDNIETLLRKYHVPLDLGLLCVDIDYNDFYVLAEILKAGYRPQAIVCEYNAIHGPTEDKVVLYDPDARWDGTNYFGASCLALANLAGLFGYALVYTDRSGTNAFFVMRRYMHLFVNVGDVERLYSSPNYRHSKGMSGGHRHDKRDRAWSSSREQLLALGADMPL